MREDQLVPYQAITRLGAGRVLVLAPHPDDEAFGCGGAIIRHCAAGDGVDVVVVTDGAFPTAPDLDLAAYAEVRREESRAAARILGYGEPEFWNYPDRGLTYGEALVQRILGLLIERGVQWLYAPSLYEIHPDHRALALSALEAARRLDAPCTLAFYEIGNPLMPNRLLDVSDLHQQLDAAWHCFTSQLAVQDYARHLDALHSFRTYTLGAGVSRAEAYWVLENAELRGRPPGLYRQLTEAWRRAGAPSQFEGRPLVSVLLEARHGQQMARALDGIALQTYPHVEVLLLDGAGLGGTQCGPFPLRRIGWAGAGGRAEALNGGLQAAQGELFILLDGGGWLYPDHLSRLVEALGQAPEVVGAYASLELVDQVGAVWAEPFDPHRLLVENYLPLGALLLRTRLLDQGCRFDGSLDGLEDWDFLLQCVGRGPLLHLDRVSAAGSLPAVAPLDPAPLWNKWRDRLGPAELGYCLAQVRQGRGAAPVAATGLGGPEARCADALRVCEHLSLVLAEARAEIQALANQSAQQAQQLSHLIAQSPTRRILRRIAAPIRRLLGRG